MRLTDADVLYAMRDHPDDWMPAWRVAARAAGSHRFADGRRVIGPLHRLIGKGLVEQRYGPHYAEYRLLKQDRKPTPEQAVTLTAAQARELLPFARDLATVCQAQAQRRRGNYYHNTKRVEAYQELVRALEGAHA